MGGCAGSLALTLVEALANDKIPNLVQLVTLLFSIFSVPLHLQSKRIFLLFFFYFLFNEIRNDEEVR